MSAATATPTTATSAIAARAAVLGRMERRASVTHRVPGRPYARRQFRSRNLGSMRRLTVSVVLATVVLISITTPAIASASTPTSDCAAHGRLTASYSVAQLQAALGSMPADIKEYTNCYAVIQRAILAKVPASRHDSAKSASTDGGSFLSAPVIIAIVVVVLGGASAGAVAFRRRAER
jgi:hypothetical protein